jgi:hypothetical protein
MLPSDPKIQQMNTAQWLWCYYNVIEDESEENNKWEDRLNYMGYYVNFDMAKDVTERKNKNNQNNNQNNNETDFIKIGSEYGYDNNYFEQELNNALNGEELIEVSGDKVGDISMLQNDFLKMAMEDSKNPLNFNIVKDNEDNQNYKNNIINNEIQNDINEGLDIILIDDEDEDNEF